MILGDNIFYGHGFGRILTQYSQHLRKELLFSDIMLTILNDMVWLNLMNQGKVISLEEKPDKTKIELCRNRFVFLWQ